MALVVEDGTGLSDADSYLSLADANTYWTNRNEATTGWGSKTDAEKEAALRIATQYLDNSYRWRGRISVGTQALGWPRTATYDHEGREISGVPTRVEDATAELAREQAVTGSLLTGYDRGGRVIREKVAVLEIQYEKNAPAGKTFPYITEMLRSLGVPIRSSTIKLGRR